MTDFPVFDRKLFLSTLTPQSGVYCMLDQSGTILYVGKARHLKQRIASYFTRANQTAKTRALVAQIAQIEVTVTHTETEALILENTLIKKHQPRYNILLRDDKSYPYIYLSNSPFPRLGLHRGPKSAKGRYFGPYPHVRAVYDSLNLLQKLFPIRQCQDSFYRHRSRPCLQYQIKRCTAPCVGLIDAASYQDEVQHAILFLEGKSQAVIEILVDKMTAAAQALEFETAAKYRDQISQLRKIQEHQYVSTEQGNLDIVVAVTQAGVSCVQMLMIRDGRQVGNHAFFPKMPASLGFEADESVEQAEITALLGAFLSQYYLDPKREIPDEIILNGDSNNISLLTEVIKQSRDQSVHIHSRVRSVRAHWVEMALENARLSLMQHQPNSYRERLAALSIALHLDILPQRLECFDISHTQGEATVGACVVFDSTGPCYDAYRRFNIENITLGDDYAAMQQVLQRRYRHRSPETMPLPDIILVDGGLGQVKVAQTVLTELQLTDICVIGIAKGIGRKPDLDTLVLPDEPTPLNLPKDSPALHLAQYLRDEAHRFAITGHRKRRSRVRRTSVLEEISGIGPQRRRHLLNYFGGLQGILQAGVADLAAVPGIDQQLAQRIYQFFKTT